MNDDLFLVNYMSKRDVDNGIPFWIYSVLLLSILGLAMAAVILVILQRILIRPLGRIDSAICAVDGGNIDYRIQSLSKTREFYKIENNFTRCAT